MESIEDSLEGWIHRVRKMASFKIRRNAIEAELQLESYIFEFHLLLCQSPGDVPCDLLERQSIDLRVRVLPFVCWSPVLETTNSSISQCCPDLVESDLTGFYRKFLGVMINPLWTQKKDSEIVLKKLPITKLCSEGFLFIWIPKGFLQIIWKLTISWGYSYVENLTWIQLKPNNKVQRLQEEENSILPTSHLTLYIFRKGGKKIEIKHQRSSDLVFDVFDPQSEFRVPQEVYNVIETMLPGSSGKLLEIWAPKTVLRDGWMHLNEGQY